MRDGSGEEMKVAWFSAGCSSLVAAFLSNPDEVIYIHVADQHPDTLRFIRDASRVLGHIEVLRSQEFSDVHDVLTRVRYINGPSGAACTLRLKKRVMQEWEKEHWGRHTYVWGYDVDERARAERTVASMPEFDHEFPLIERGLTKSDCHAMCDDIGIRRPAMYDLGYPNNNCVGCVKGGMGYWNKIREDFPEVFAQRAKDEREVGHSCIKGVFLDELEPGRGVNNPVVPDCSLACALAESQTPDA